MAKMGRPKAESPRLKTLSVRVTKEEYQKLQEYASKHDLTITQVVHKGVNLLYDKTP